MWTKGKRRNADAGDWGIVRLKLKSLLDNYVIPGTLSIRALAKSLGVDDASVRKWLSGENRPDIETQDRIRTWCREMRELIKRTKME